MSSKTNPFEPLLRKEVQDFIAHFQGDATTLALQGSPFNNIPTATLIQQVEGFRKSEKKLPHWHLTANIIYPQKLSLEQASSEITAQYKASIVQGTRLADLTGGFGVDAFFFSKRFQEVHHFEVNPELSRIAMDNFAQLGANNIICHSQDGMKGLDRERFDVVYIDPARRHQEKGKVFFLKDCEPDVTTHLDFLLDHCHTLLIKTSPMLDLAMGIQELKCVTEIHVVAVQNEVKELLWLVSRESPKEIMVKTINLTNDGRQCFDFPYASAVSMQYAHPQKYVYEPNAAILKAGAFQQIGNSYPVFKLAAHSHLYTSDALIPFPGRAFAVEKVLPYQKKIIRTQLPAKAHITTRNFPETVAQLRKKWNIREGGDAYLFFSTLESGGKVVLFCKKPHKGS